MRGSLGEAHAQGIVHRDLKPENVYLERAAATPTSSRCSTSASPRSCAATGWRSRPALTATGQTLGTLEYMSPEQLMGKQLDGRSDLYALGVLAYELIDRGLPFPDARRRAS